MKNVGDHVLNIDKEIFDKVAILKTCYLFQEEYNVKVESLSKLSYGVFLSKKDGEIDIQRIENDFNNELIDQQIRLENEQMYGEIRRNIVKQAFKPLAFEELGSKINNQDI